jgi:phosphoribosylformimino-5-aminoimidazole carboxamide ribotide isomerase
MMAGVNIDATVRLAQSMTIPVIASGGVHNIKDVEALCAVQDEGIEGVICGRSIYEGTLNLREAQERADVLSGLEEAEEDEA